MNEPVIGSAVTQEQIDGALNYSSFSDDGLTPDSEKNWHQGPESGGQFEPWSIAFGYPEGFPRYGGTKTSSGVKIHIYWLPTKSGTCILPPGKTPQDYGIEP
ncbi:MAG: hypothetical protein PVH61_16675 [Candidatus Aminicenantes bacterium]|jgi:hypothetical protein